MRLYAPGAGAWSVTPAGSIPRHVIEAAKTAPVPQRVQHVDPKTGDREGNCGFYALGMIMDAHHLRNPRNPTALVQDKDEKSRRHASLAPTTPRRMLDFALRRRLTNTGEMFDAALVKEVAAHIGYEAKVHRRSNLKTLYAMVDRGQPAMIAVDVGKTGNLAEAGGKLAHFVVIQGRFEYGGQNYVVARHGWGVESDHVWREDDLLRSWGGLRATDYWGAPRDITYGLGRAIIEVPPIA